MNPKNETAKNEPMERGTLGRPIHPLLLALIVATAFSLYWATSFILVANGAATRFGADTWFYTEIADGDALSRLHESQYLGRVFRFHPVTVIAGTIWMNALDWLTQWLEQEQVLRAMFALTGALGGYAAMSGFAAVMRARHVAFWGAIYAVSLAVWYFSSIEESKIVSATLATLYIAIYLHLRENWTQRNAILLTVVLFLACMNEIVAGFLVIIPVVDTLIRYGIDFLRGRWIVLHAMAGPVALGILEWIARSRFEAASQHPEGGTHFSMLFWYVTQNDYTFEAAYAFAVRWLFFSIGAPEAKIHFANPAIGYGGDFFPLLSIYFYSPVTAALVVLFAVLLLASFLPRFRAPVTREAAGILAGLAAYILLRGAFFFLLLPQEYMLFASSITFALLLLVAIPFSRSAFPRKRILLALFATALFLANGAFMLAPQASP
jgi:hypothetical protein